ncbi:50S ribosomal protein L25, partial [Cutibacterium acnes]
MIDWPPTWASARRAVLRQREGDAAMADIIHLKAEQRT